MGYLTDNVTFSPLHENIINEAKDFSCGHTDIDDFFHNDSATYSRSLFGKSYCFQSTDNRQDIIGAFTVSNASIFTNRLPNARKKKIGKDLPQQKRELIYPAVLIGRLGVNCKYQKHHIGSEMLDFIKAWFTEPKNKTGCRYLVVDAYNSENPISFYLRNDFDFMFSSEEQEKDYRNINSDSPLLTRLMYFDLIRIIEK